MAGLQQMIDQGAMQQPQQMMTQVDPRITQAIEQIYAQQMTPPSGDMFGAGRFLSGPSIPMTFNVPVPQYESPNLTPGDFQNFMAALGSSSGGKTAIPVFNPGSGTYDTSFYSPPKA